MSKSQVQRLLAAAKPEEREIVKWLYLTGMRVSELRTAYREDGSVLVIHGKGGKTRRVAVPVELGDPPRLPKHTARRRVKAAAARAGMPHVTPHWLRHAHAAHSLQAGAPLTEVQKALGHAFLTTTARYLSFSEVPNTASRLQV